MKNYSINFYTAGDPATKAAICERFIRTIKSIMYKYFTHKKIKTYINVLNELTKIYNNRRHRSIGMSPCEVNDKNVLNVWKNLKKSVKLGIKSSPKYKIGYFVRIAKSKETFKKSYKPGWSNQIFTIDKVLSRHPPVYILKDMNNEVIKGIFYEPEIQKIDFDKNDLSVNNKIDKLLYTVQNGGSRLYLVKWNGYSNKFNSKMLK